MNNFTLDRIRSQLDRPKPIPLAPSEAIFKEQPLDAEQLRKILEPEFVEKHVSLDSELHFSDIYDFSAWYTDNREKFSSHQKQALDTILTTRKMIDNGCNCKRTSREHAANGYFAEFWTNNKTTDLLPTISKVTGFPRVSVANFCNFP